MTRSMHNDPVCGMRIRDDSEFTAAYRGREYHFCSARCRDRFAAEPTTYVGAEHEREHQHEHERAAAPLPRFAFAAVVCVFAAISVFFLLSEHRAHFFGVLPYLLLLACPFLHLFLHRGHGHRH